MHRDAGERHPYSRSDHGVEHASGGDVYEVEVKVAAEHDAVRERLPEDAEALGTVEQIDTYFDAPHRDFAETDEALRLRRERQVDGRSDAGADAVDGGQENAEAWTTEITYKGPLLEAESKTREEFETIVADGDELESALERLGFEPAAEVRKLRERYAVDEFTVTLDAVDGLGRETGIGSDGPGEFVEVETDVETEAAIEAARDAAFDRLDSLGSDPDEQIRTSYLGLLLDAAE